MFYCDVLGTPSKDSGIGDAIGQRTLTSQRSEMPGEEFHIWGQVSVFQVVTLSR